MHARRLIVTVVCACAVLIPSAASATDYVADTCSMLTNWTVSPALTTGSHSGTIYASYAGSCAGAGADTNVGFDESFYPATWDNSFPSPYGYFGSCALATTSYYGSWGSGTLIGGSVFFGIASNPYYSPGELTEVTVVAPLIPCSETSATGYSQASFVGSF